MGKALSLFLAAFLFSGCTGETYDGTWRPNVKPCARVKTGGLAANVAKSTTTTYEFCDPHYRVIHGEERLDARGNPLGLALVIGGESAGQNVDVWTFADDLKANGTLTIQKTSIVTAKSFFATLFLIFFGIFLFFVIRSGRRARAEERAEAEATRRAEEARARMAEAKANAEREAKQEQKAEEPLKPQPEQTPPAPASLLVGTLTENGEQFFLSPDTRARHLYLIGKTRTGKTTLIQNLITQDLRAGHGLCFLDPHGDAALELLGNVPAERVKDVIYFDPMRADAPAFNPLRLPQPPFKLTEDLISIFKMFFSNSWGQRMEDVLRSCFLTLISQQDPRTLADLRRLLTNKDFRAEVVCTTENETLREFWEQIFPTIEKAAVNPVINKLSALLAPTSPLERVFSEKENDLDFSDILNTSKILIVNLSKGTLGDEPSRLLGGFITTGIQQAALARASLPEAERKPFYFYVDEFQNYAVASFETILAEASKYRLFLTLANQNLGQLASSLERAIFGNVGTLISFQVSADDASALKKEMHCSRVSARASGEPDFTPVPDFLTTQRRDLTAAQMRLQEDIKNCERRAKFIVDAWQGRIFDAADQREYNRRIEEEKKEYKWSHDELADVTRKLKALDNPTNNVHSLRDIFPDYQFKETAFPDVDEFLNLPPYHAFCRIERADNVSFFRALPAPSPDKTRRADVLNYQHRRAQQKVKRQETNNARHNAPPRPTQKPPKEEEDFKF